MEHYDLIVVGGGQAGCSAALAAARAGVRVLLIEAGGALGGAAVNCLITPYMPNHTKIPDACGDKQDIELTQGIYREMYEALNRDEIYGFSQHRVNIPEESMKVIYDRKMKEAGVTVLFHATLSHVDRDGDAVTAVHVATVGGEYVFGADTFIDATGDATLTALAGSPFRLGRPADSLCQPMTLCFRIGNVDMKEFSAHRDEITPLYREWQAAGKLKNPRENVLIFTTCLPNVLHFNTTRIVKLNPTDPFDVSRAEAEAREQVVEMVHFLKTNFAAFAHADLLMTAASIGVRESRMIDARHVLTGEELMAGTKFPDAIAAGNYDIDIHSPDGSGTSHYYFPEGVYYTIPYRSLLPRDLSNLLVVGRSIGATHEAQASVRIMPICSATGEAAGVAAAVAKECGVAAADVDTDLLQDRLRKAGAFLG